MLNLCISVNWLMSPISGPLTWVFSISIHFKNDGRLSNENVPLIGTLFTDNVASFAFSTIKSESRVAVVARLCRTNNSRFESAARVVGKEPVTYSVSPTICNSVTVSPSASHVTPFHEHGLATVHQCKNEACVLNVAMFVLAHMSKNTARSESGISPETLDNKIKTRKNPTPIKRPLIVGK